MLQKQSKSHFVKVINFLKKAKITSVNVMTSLPESSEPNLTLLTPHPGARYAPLDQFHGSSDNHPLATPESLVVGPLPPPGNRVLSVWKTFSGFELRTSHMTTAPSWDATANFVPFDEKAVEKDAAMLDEDE